MRLILMAGVVLLASIISAQAKDLGMEFKSMPKGTTAHYVDSGGHRFKYTYQGKFGDRYLIQVSGSRNYQKFYNEDGFLVMNRYNDYAVRFRPFFCERKLGQCQFNYDALSSKFSGNWNANMFKTKKGYTFRLIPVNKNSDRGGDSFYKFGKYNFVSEYVVGSSWLRLEKITIGSQ
jgi:hypothetical protein